MDEADQQDAWLSAAIETFGRNKRLADNAIAQLTEEQLRRSLDPATNSVAVIMKHVAGNLRSRWTDFLTTDGEKPDRDRDNEFTDDYADRDQMLSDWESGWAVLFQELDRLGPEDTLRSATIRGVPHTVPYALTRSMTHCAYHIGQIVLIARIVAGEDWLTLTIAKGQSKEFNREHWGKPQP